MTTTLDPRPMGVRQRHIAGLREAWLDAQSRERAYYLLLAETDGMIDHETARELHHATNAACVAYLEAVGVGL
ncbi:MAG TPA: hypothetical protein VF981_16615 [Gemmatimonadaceae bacterium]